MTNIIDFQEYKVNKEWEQDDLRQDEQWKEFSNYCQSKGIEENYENSMDYFYGGKDED